MAATELVVILNGSIAGILAQDDQGLTSFRYDENYAGPPLSLSMPLSNRTFRHKAVLPYLFGLLPDDERQRRAIAREYGVRPNNPVALLGHIGLDCPGSVQFCQKGQVDAVLSRAGAYHRLDEASIAQRLRMLREDGDSTWAGKQESWSLGGNQGKFALALCEGSWCECLGSAPTTHIFKNGVAGFKFQALNEYVCMKTAARCGVATAPVSYRLFEDEPALIVERYDRIVTSDGRVMRIHQEDLCQALGVMPAEKYTADGGPTTHDIVRLLSTTDQADYNLRAFTKALFFNYLIGAPDAHAKNYSLLLGIGRDALLSRMYDVASGLAYESLRRHGRLAMSIGGENRWGRVGRDAVARYARLTAAVGTGLTEKSCRAIMVNLAQAIPPRMHAVFDEAQAQGIPHIPELREHLEHHVARNCEETLALL